MSIIQSPSLVTSGLALCIDSGNNKSYTGGENLVSHSTYNAATWGTSAAATFTTGIIAPDGTATAVRVTASPSATTLIRLGVPSFTPNGTDFYTVSFYARLISFSGTPQLPMDLADGTPQTGDYFSQLVQNQWVRLSFTGVPSNAAKTFLDLISDRTITCVVDFWGVQIQKGGYATDYIPTSGSIVTGQTTVTDITGNGNTGTIGGGLTFGGNNANRYFNFDGVDDGIQLADTSLWWIDQNRSLSMSAWFYCPPTIVSGSKLFSLQKCNQPVLSIDIDSTTRVGFRFGQSGSYLYYNINVANSAWHNVTVSYDGTSKLRRIYVDGVLGATDTLNETFANTSGNSEMWIGRRFNCGGTNQFLGRIGHFSVYNNKVLTSEEVLQNFNALRGRYGV